MVVKEHESILEISHIVLNNSPLNFSRDGRGEFQNNIFGKSALTFQNFNKTRDNSSALINDSRWDSFIFAKDAIEVTDTKEDHDDKYVTS